MEWRKLKNLIILILLVVNGFLLVLAGSRWEESVRYERVALVQTVQVLKKNGIEVEPDADDLADSLAPMAVERDLEREGRLVCALLGEEVRGDNRGGGLYLYQGALGEVSVRSGGELSAEFRNDGRWSTENPAEHAAGLLSKMGVDGIQTSVSTHGGQISVRFRQNWNGAAVFSCEVEFGYRDGQLKSLSGTLLTAESGSVEGGETLTLPTALMRFSEEIAATGDVCSAIRSMEAGYRGSVQSLSGGTRLAPVWLVTTNTAGYYLDCATGALTRVTDQ